MRYLFILALVSCSNMHLKVTSDYESSTAKGKFEFEKSYDLASWPWLCGFSFWYFGGACWAYNMMPTVPQENLAIKEAETALKEQLGQDAIMLNPVVVRESWSKSDTKTNVQ